MNGDLTSLAAVRLWLGGEVTGTSSDVLLQSLITAASRFVLNYIQRTGLAAQDITEVRDGGGNSFMVLRQWPVISVASVGWAGQSITAQGAINPPASGLLLDPAPSGGGAQRLSLLGWAFPRVRSGISITYRAGYVTTEAHLVPASPYQVTTDMLWLADEGVTTLGGLALVRVTGTPATGQYAVSATGTYLFAAADVGTTMVISYSYVPPDIQQAVNELVSERYKYRDRIGVNSKSLGGQETISFSTKDLSKYTELLLNPYRRVV